MLQNSMLDFVADKEVEVFQRLGSTSELQLPGCRVEVSTSFMYEKRWKSGSKALIFVSDSNDQKVALLENFRKKFHVDGTGGVNGGRVGDFGVVCSVWPSSGLKGKSIVLSSTALAMLGHPADDMQINAVLIDGVCQVHDVSPFTVTVEILLCGNGNGCTREASPEKKNSVNDDGKIPHGSIRRARATPQSRGKRFVNMSPNMRQSALQTPPSKTVETKQKTEALELDAVQEDEMMELLKESLFNEGSNRTKDVLKTLLLSRCWQGVALLSGNIVPLSALGISILARLDFGQVDGAEGLMCAHLNQKIKIKFIEFGSQQRDNSECAKVSDQGYAVEAAQLVVDDLGMEGEGAAHEAVYRAAWLGLKSLHESQDSKFGGLERRVRQLEKWVCYPLKNFSLLCSQGVLPPAGVLLHGPPGTGKTLLARVIAKRSDSKLFVINGSDLTSEYMGESEKCLKGIFYAAKRLSPSIIFVDEIDALAPTRAQDSASSKASSRLVATLANELDEISGYPVMILGATNRKDSIDESLRRPGRLDRELEIPVPAPSDRLEILAALLSSMSHGLSREDISYFAEMTHGFVGADLMSLCSEASMIALRRLHADANAERLITRSDITTAMRGTRPSALREFSAVVPHASWSDVGGLSEVKQKLREVVDWPIKYRDSLQRVGAVAPKGILLCGPPGCSKTLLARAVAGEANLNFFSIKGPELLSKFVGESEKSIANLFDKARKASPAILFFDEIDGLVGARSNDKSSTSVDVSERVLSQMLQEMDGIRGQAENLIVIAATNRPDRLDKALLRPGRFDRVVEVGLPSAKDRQEIFQVHTQHIPMDTTVNLTELAGSTDGFSGADIAGLCQQAAMIALASSAQQVSMAAFTQALAARDRSKDQGIDFSLYIRSV